MNAKVYHVKRNAPRGIAFHEHPEPWKERRGHYTLVAEYETTELSDSKEGHISFCECIFEEENLAGEGSVDNGTDTPEHIERTESVRPRRSLSVGDVVLVDGVPYECSRIGWREISNRNENGSTGSDPYPIE